MYFIESVGYFMLSVFESKYENDCSIGDVGNISTDSVGRGYHVTRQGLLPSLSSFARFPQGFICYPCAAMSWYHSTASRGRVLSSVIHEQCQCFATSLGLSHLGFWYHKSLFGFPSRVRRLPVRFLFGYLGVTSK